MQHIKTYTQFRESLKIDLSLLSIDLNESLSIWYNSILESIDAKEVDIYDTLNLDKSEDLNLDVLSNNIEFINALSSVGMKKSALQNTEDFETFLNKPLRFMFIYRIEADELENPSYILLQVWNETLSSWEDTRLYKVNDDIKKFYDKLSSKTIEITNGEDKYIYTTSNGNEWTLQNKQETESFKKYYRSGDFEELIKSNNVKINII